MEPTRLVLLITLIVAWPHVAWTQQRFVRVEGGVTAVHNEVLPSAGIHFLLPLSKRQPTRLDIGAFVDRHALSADVGVSSRMPTNSRLGLILRGGGGLLFEAEWRGPYVRAGTGLDWRLSPTLSVGFTLDAGVHDGLGGPYRLMISVVRQVRPGV